MRANTSIAATTDSDRLGELGLVPPVEYEAHHHAQTHARQTADV